MRTMVAFVVAFVFCLAGAQGPEETRRPFGIVTAHEPLLTTAIQITGRVQRTIRAQSVEVFLRTVAME